MPGILWHVIFCLDFFDSNEFHVSFIRFKITSKGRFTRCDFDACDKLTTGLRHDLGPFTRAGLFSLTKLNMQKFEPGFTERMF